MKIQRIDTQRDDVEHALGALRERLSPRGEVVSEAGRARTVKVFGQPLSPQEVVERICGDVRRQGLDALLRYTLQLDDASLDASTIRVSTSELEEAHETADPQFLATIRAIRENRKSCAVTSKSFGLMAVFFGSGTLPSNVWGFAFREERRPTPPPC